jgi:RNA polymerase sigma factor (sigma-70 family)
LFPSINCNLIRREGEHIQDDVLIRKIRDGNEQALRMLIEKYKQHIFNITFSVTKDVQEAEDLAQETFMKMVDALPSYQSQGFKTWISRIAFHTSIDYYRKKKRRNEELTTFDTPMIHQQTKDSAEKTMLQETRIKSIRKAIQNMPDTYRDVVFLYYIDEKSYSDIAKELNLAEKTIEMRLYRARKWMKENWKEDEF